MELEKFTMPFVSMFITRTRLQYEQGSLSGFIRREKNRHGLLYKLVQYGSFMNS